MRPLRRKQQSESQLIDVLRRALFADGWLLVEKTHGNEYMHGWPDLWCYRSAGGQWVEVKRPQGKLTKAQVSRFAAWELAGCSVWVVSSVNELQMLDGAANWRDWLTPAQCRLLGGA